MSKWYEKTLEEKSNIIYSRIRIARNWDEYVFPSRLDVEGSRELVDGLKDGLKEIPYPYYALENMQQAVEQADRLAKPGDIVLLSPASASFGMYKNFEYRGIDFKNRVNAL